VPALGTTVGEALLAPHRSYARALGPLCEAGLIKGMAHITGGGMTENLPRVLPAGCGCEIDRSTWSVLPIFDFLRERGGIAIDEMFRAFNMGIGLIIVCATGDVDRIRILLAESGEPGSALIGSVTNGSGVVYVS